MPAEKATAIVLRTYDFSESSLVVTLLTREFGKVQGLAKGGKRLKGPFESALDLLARCRIVFLRKTSDALDLLTEAKLERRFRIDRTGLAGLYAGYYVAELLCDFTDNHDPHPELFDLAEETLADLNACESVAKRIMRFELGLLRLLGHMPSLDSCVHCGCEVPRTGTVPFGQLDGGVLCGACRNGRRQVAMISAGAIRAMAVMMDLQSDAWQRLDLGGRGQGELRGVLNRYLCNLLGKKPRMHDHLAIMSTHG